MVYTKGLYIKIARHKKKAVTIFEFAFSAGIIIATVKRWDS